MGEPIMRRLHVLGRRELALLVGGPDKLPADDAVPAVDELQEAAIPAHYGTFFEGSLMRTLQDFCFYHEDGVPAPIEALDDKFSKKKVMGFGTVLPPEYRPKPKEKKGAGGGGGAGGKIAGSVSSASLATEASSAVVPGGPVTTTTTGGLKLKIRLKPEHAGGGGGGGGGGGETAAAEGGSGGGSGVKRLRVLGESEAAARKKQAMEEGGGVGGGGGDAATDTPTQPPQDENTEDWDTVGLRVWLPEITEWCIDYSLDGHAVLWVVTSTGAWYRLAGTAFSFLKPHPLYARMYQSAARKFRACAITARQLVLAYRQDPLATYQGVLSSILAASGGKLAEQTLLENADFIGAQMGGLQDPGGPVVKFDACSFVEGLKGKARGEGVRPMTKKDRDKLAREIGRAQKEIVKTWVAELQAEAEMEAQALAEAAALAVGGHLHTHVHGHAHMQQQQQQQHTEEEQQYVSQENEDEQLGLLQDDGEEEGQEGEGEGEHAQTHNHPQHDSHSLDGGGVEGWGEELNVHDHVKEEGGGGGGALVGGGGLAPPFHFTHHAPPPLQGEGMEVDPHGHGPGHAHTHAHAHTHHHQQQDPTQHQPEPSPTGTVTGGEEDETRSRSSTTIKLKTRLSKPDPSTDGRRKKDSSYHHHSRSSEDRIELDDLVILGADADIPRPLNPPASTVLPRDLFPSVLTTWSTLQVCGSGLLRLTPFPLQWLENAVTTNVKGLIPGLVQEVIHRLLATILTDRKDKNRPVSVNVLDEECEEEESTGRRGGGGGEGKVGGAIGRWRRLSLFCIVGRGLISFFPLGGRSSHAS